MLLKRKCPICGTLQGEAIKKISINISTEMREKIAYPNSYDVVSCNDCGMLFADAELTKEDVDNYYINCNMYDNVSDVKKDVYDEVCELYYSAIKPYTTLKSHIIDIGCGNGRFLRYLKEKGFKELYGLDPAVNSIHKLESSQIKGIVGSIYDEVTEELERKFDVVICSGVLEHLLLPDIGLKNLVKLLSHKGILYLAVPNAEGFEKYLREIPNYFNQEHINYFTSNTLDSLCTRNGLVRCSPKEECYHVMCPSSPEMVISAVYCKGNSEGLRIEHDDSGAKSSKAYFAKIEQKQQKTQNIVKELLKGGDQIIIWGTGGFAASLVKDIPELLDKTAFFVDNDSNKQRDTFFGRNVISPKMLEHYTQMTIVVCVMMNCISIKEQIKEMQLTNKVVYLC